MELLTLSLRELTRGMYPAIDPAQETSLIQTPLVISWLYGNPEQAPEIPGGLAGKPSTRVRRLQRAGSSFSFDQMPQQPLSFRPVAQAGFSIDMPRGPDIDESAAP